MFSSSAERWLQIMDGVDGGRFCVAYLPGQKPGELGASISSSMKK
jgi:hypothetical protein